MNGKIGNQKKKIFGILLMICILQLGLSLFITGQKTYLAPDELFSYVSANNPDYIGEVPKNTWLDETWYTDYVSAQPEHRFEYSVPYHNQDQDVHPPLFYIFLHTAASMVPEQFSYYTGTAFNILFFLICTIVLYELGKEIFDSSVCGLISAFLFGISYAGLNTVVFVRMYMLMTLLVLLHVLVYMKYMEREEIPLKGYIFLGLTLVLGMLTQYYFVVIAFFFALWYGIRMLLQKDHQKVCRFVMVFIVSGVTSIALYPSMLHHIFGTSRGAEARENFSTSGGYLEKLKTMWGILDSQLFTGLGIFLIAALFILAASCVIRKKYPEKQWIRKTGTVLFACAGYFLVVTKIAPYQIDRYLMPIYPLVYLAAIGWMWVFLKQWIPERAAVILCIMGFGGLSVIHTVHSSIPYTYTKDTVITQRLELAEMYQDQYVLYLGEETDMYDYFEAVQVLQKYEGFYNVKDLTDVSAVKNDMECLENEDSILLYISNDIDPEEAEAFISGLFPESVLDIEKPLQTDEEWQVYLLDSM